MHLQVPGKDAHLVEVVGQPRRIRPQHGQVDRDVLVVLLGAVVMHGGQNVRAHEALSFGIARQRVGRIHIHIVGEQPTGAAPGIARQPPVLHGNRRHGLRFQGIRRFYRGRARRHRLGQRRPLEQLHLIALRQPVEDLRCPARPQVQVHLVAHHCRGHRRIVLMRLRQGLELVKNLLRGHRLLVDPALLPLLRLHAVEAPSVLQHLEPLAVLHRRGAVGDGSHAVAKVGLLGRHIHRFGCRPRPQMRAPAQHRSPQRSHAEERPETRPYGAANRSPQAKPRDRQHPGKGSKRTIGNVVRHIFQHTGQNAPPRALLRAGVGRQAENGIFPRKLPPLPVFCRPVQGKIALCCQFAFHPVN